MLTIFKVIVCINLSYPLFFYHLENLSLRDDDDEKIIFRVNARECSPHRLTIVKKILILHDGRMMKLRHSSSSLFFSAFNTFNLASDVVTSHPLSSHFQKIHHFNEFAFYSPFPRKPVAPVMNIDFFW